MSAAHTPGPWRVADDADVVNRQGALGKDVFSNANGVEHGDTGICCVAIGSRLVGNDFVDPRREANARLIAAAPDLLAALVALVDSFETHRPKALWDNARTAIAKATS